MHVHWPAAPQGKSRPSRHARPAQHERLPAAQPWPAPVHAAVWQVPDVIPPGMVHESPLQQSAVVVHTPAAG